MAFSERFLVYANSFINIVSYSVVLRWKIGDEIIRVFCENYGLPEDYSRMIVTLIICIPLAYIQSIIKSSKAKKIYSIVFGVWILQFCFGVGWIHSLLSSTVVYLIMKYCNPKKQPIYVFFFSLSYLSATSIYTMLTNYMSYALDSTTYQMLLIGRFQMLAWALYDGTIDRNTVDIGAAKDDRMSHVYKRRQAEYIDALPSLLDYYSFVYHFPGLLGGPNIYYREFIEVMTNKRYPDGIPNIRLWTAAKKLLIGIIGFVLYIIASIYFPIEYTLSNDFASKKLPIRLLLLYLTFLGCRCRYFGIWKFGEGMCIINGFGEVNEDNGHNWNGISNVDIIGFETACDYSKVAKLWNIRIQKWLQMCIYERSHFNQFYVFMVSAFWHGFYPSYYCGFGLASFMTLVNRLATKKLWPRVQGTVLEKPYILAGRVLCALCNSFMLAAHCCYSFERAMLIWRQSDFFMPIVLLCGFVVLSIIPLPQNSDKTNKKD